MEKLKFYTLRIVLRGTDIPMHLNFDTEQGRDDIAKSFFSAMDKGAVITVNNFQFIAHADNIISVTKL